MSRVKAYTLFGSPSRLSAQTVDYRGWSCDVAAVSIRQAYYFAGNGVWAEDVDNPLGIIVKYERGAGEPGDHWLWDGCRIYGGLLIRHGDGKRAISTAMKGHLAEHETEEERTA